MNSQTSRRKAQSRTSGRKQTIEPQWYVRSPVTTGKGARAALAVGSERYEELRRQYPEYFQTAKQFTKGSLPGREILTPELAKTLPEKEIRRRFAGSSNAGKYASWGLTEDQFCGPEGGSAAGSYPVPDYQHQQNAISRARFAPNPQGIIECAIRHEVQDGHIPVDEAEAKLASYQIRDPKQARANAMKYLNQQLNARGITQEQHEARVQALDTLLQKIQRAKNEDALSRARLEYVKQVRNEITELKRSSMRVPSRYTDIPKSIYPGGKRSGIKRSGRRGRSSKGGDDDDTFGTSPPSPRSASPGGSDFDTASTIKTVDDETASAKREMEMFQSTCTPFDLPMTSYSVEGKDRWILRGQLARSNALYQEAETTVTKLKKNAQVNATESSADTIFVAIDGYWWKIEMRLGEMIEPKEIIEYKSLQLPPTIHAIVYGLWMSCL